MFLLLFAGFLIRYKQHDGILVAVCCLLEIQAT